MWKLVESSPFLRTLNFVRVRHPDRLRYLIVYPAIFTVPIMFAVRLSSGSFHQANIGAVLEPIAPLVVLLLPFFVASLAATSTFHGPKGFDAPFTMHKDVKLLISHRGGSKDIDVTPRHFLSLLFSYVSVLCIFLVFAISLEANASLKGFAAFPKLVGFLKSVFLASTLVVIGQVLVATGVAIYYLGDFIHRLSHR